MKKILVILFNLAVVTYMVFALAFTGAKSDKIICSRVKISMLDSMYSGFLQKQDIEEILLESEEQIAGYPMSEINLNLLEESIRRNPYVRNAEVYSTTDGVLHIDVFERIPVVRIISGSGSSYYLDDEGYIFPARGGISSHVLIANGYFTFSNQLNKIRNIAEIDEEEDYSEWFEVHRLAGFIVADPFWEKQVVQLYYNREGDFELIPRVGAHQVIFGKIDNMEYKFWKLKTLYNEGFSYEGWNKYEKINLKFNNQVICTKR